MVLLNKFKEVFMLKYIIGLFVIVILFNITNSIFSSSKTEVNQRTKSIEISNNDTDEYSKTIEEQNNYSKNNDDNRSSILNSLWEKANRAFNKTLDEEALKIYDEILKLIGDSSKPKDLKMLANVYFKKAILYQLYPNNDIDLAKENYQFIIKKFENSENIDILNLYIDAKQQLANLLSTDEQIELYDELIARFQNNPAFSAKIEEILFNESFLLAGKDDERAMEVLDSLIQKYQDKDKNIKLPTNIQNSIINNIELAIITNSEDDDYRELADKYMENEPDTKPLLDMLEIVRNAQDYEQNELFEQWNSNYPDYQFPDWSFQELKRWAYQMENTEAQTRVLDYINNFERRKYTNRYNNSSGEERVQVNGESDDYEHQSSTTIYQNDQQTERTPLYADPYAEPYDESNSNNNPSDSSNQEIYNSNNDNSPIEYEPSEEAIYYQDAHSQEKEKPVHAVN